MKKRTSILIIAPTPPPYHGVSVATEIIVSSRLKEVFDLILLDIADRRGINKVGHPDMKDVWLSVIHCSRYLWLLMKAQPQVVYFNCSQSALGYLRDTFFILFAFVARKKIIMHLHGGNFRNFYEQSQSFMKFLIRWTLKKVSRVIVLGETLKYLFQGFVPTERIIAIPNGVDIKPFEEIRQSLNVQKNPRRILYLGTLMKEKGIIDILESIPHILGKKQKDTNGFALTLTKFQPL